MQDLILTNMELTWRTDQRYDPELERPIWSVWITGPLGTVTATNMATVIDRLDYIEWLYEEIIMCLTGMYHCCLTGFTDWA
jgi:hypothetical protein